jgi:hypothetical protein
MPSEIGKIVKEGTYLYDGAVPCGVRIRFQSVRFGTGDYEDPFEVAEDQAIPTYYIEFSVTTDVNDFRSGGGGFESLEDAVAHLHSVPYVASSLRWK